MTANPPPDLDLMPPAFSDGLDDWSRGDGTPDSPTYQFSQDATLVRGDADFGTCLALRKTQAVQRLRYMGEVPLRQGAFIEIAARLKAVSGPLPMARLAAWPGGAGGTGIDDLQAIGQLEPLIAPDAVRDLRMIVGPDDLPGVDLVWDARVRYAHVGLDLVGPLGGVVRIENLRVREVTAAIAGSRLLPGFDNRAARPRLTVV